MYNGKLGIGIISFDRNTYLEKMLVSLYKNTHLDNTDIHLYQDGWINRFTKQSLVMPPGSHTPPQTGFQTVEQRVKRCVEIFDSMPLKNKSIHQRQENVSIAINQFEAVEDLTANYEYILLLEDDVVLSPHYLRLIRVLIDQFKNVDDVFSVSLNFRKLCDLKDYTPHINRVIYARCHWWAECFSAKKWKIIRPHFLRYYDLVKHILYSQRPREPIMKLFEELGFPTEVTSQDAAKEASTIHCGLKRVNTIVNRGICIGEHGTHFGPTTYQNHKLHLQEPYIFDSDKEIEEFTF